MRRVEFRGARARELLETFYARASWLSATKILSITEKRALLNSAGIDIHSEACYVKVTASALGREREKGREERMRAAYRKRKREAAEKWHEGEAKGEKNWSAERRRRGEER